MKYLILGLGNVGRELARRLTTDGHHVVGTTTTPSKVEALRDVASDVVVARGTDSEVIAAAGRDADAIIVSVAPSVRQAKTPEERETQYADVLVRSCESAAATSPRVVFMSSFSVYGDGGEGDAAITESTPTSNEEEPSSKYYQLAERAVLASSQGCVLRLPDIYGAPGDMSFADRVRLAHQIMGGRVPFSADAPLYRIHYLDVVSAVRHVLAHDLTGIFNVCSNDGVPPTNREVFDRLAAEQGLDPLQFADQIKAPMRKISSAKLHDTGFGLAHTQAEVV